MRMNKSYENCKPDKSIKMYQSDSQYENLGYQLLDESYSSDQQSIRRDPDEGSRRDLRKRSQTSSAPSAPLVEDLPFGEYVDVAPVDQQVLHGTIPSNINLPRPNDPGVYVLAETDDGLEYVHVGEVGGRLSQISRPLRRQVELGFKAITISDVKFDANAIAAMMELDDVYMSDVLAKTSTHTYTRYRHNLEDYNAPLSLKNVNRRYNIDDKVQMSTQPSRRGDIDRSEIDRIVDDQRCIGATEAMRYLSVGNAQDFPCAFWERVWLQQAYKRQIGSVTPVTADGEYPKPIAYRTNTSNVRSVVGMLFNQMKGLDVLQFADGEWVISVKAPSDFNPSRGGMEIVFHKQFDSRDPDLTDFFRRINRVRPANGRSTMEYREVSIPNPGGVGGAIKINMVVDMIPRESILEIQACADLPDEYLVMSIKNNQGFKAITYLASGIDSRDCYLDPSVLSYDYLMRVYEYKKRTPGARFFMPAQRLLKLPPGGYAEVAKTIGSLFSLNRNRLSLDETFITDLVSVFRRDLIHSLSNESSPEGIEKVADFYTGILSLMYLTFHGVMPNPAVVFHDSSYIFREMMVDEFPYLYSYTRDVHYRLFGDSLLKLAFRYTRGPNSKFRPVFPAEIVLSRVYTIMGQFAGLDVFAYNDVRKKLDSTHLLEKLPSYVNTRDRHSLFFSGMDAKWKRRIWNILDFPEPTSIKSVEEMAKLDEVFNRYVDIDANEAKYLNDIHRFKYSEDIKLNRIKQPTAPPQGMNAREEYLAGRREHQGMNAREEYLAGRREHQPDFDFRRIDVVRDVFFTRGDQVYQYTTEPMTMKERVNTFTGRRWNQ